MNKNILIAAVTLGIQASTFASNYSFTPSPSDLWDLDHNYYYRWVIQDLGLGAEVPETAPITSATLTFSNIRDWTDESDLLRIYLVNYSGQANSTARAAYAVDGGTAYLSGLTYTLVGSWSDLVGPYGENATGTTETFTFNASLLSTLNNYAADGNFGFIIDPDCHYFNDGVRFDISTRPNNVPDGGSTAGLLGLGLLALWGVRRLKLA